MWQSRRPKLVAVFVVVSNSLVFVHKNGDEQKQSLKLFVLEFACIMWFMEGGGASAESGLPLLNSILLRPEL